MRNRINPLTMEEIQQAAPSAFAGQAYHKQSDRYTFIPTSDVIEEMASAGFVPVSAQQSRTKIEGKELFTKHMIRFRSTDQQLNVVGDSLLEAVLINSHDGTSRYKLMGGVFRLACLNGLIVAESMFAAVSIKHTGNVIQEVIQGTQNFFGQAPKVLSAIREWQGIQLRESEQLVLAEAARTIRFADNDGVVSTPVTPEMLLKPRRYDDNGNDLWHTFNRVQENVTKGFRTNQRSEGRRIGARAIRSIDGDVRLNRALWEMGEKMAEIKKNNL
jgi:hypothetical protein